jgi:hypothetical protein
MNKKRVVIQRRAFFCIRVRKARKTRLQPPLVSGMQRAMYSCAIGAIAAHDPHIE